MLANKKGLGAALIGALMALAAFTSPGQALDTTNIAFVQTAGGTTSIPVGHAEFCKSRPDECRPNANPAAFVSLTEGLWQQAAWPALWLCAVGLLPVWWLVRQQR